MKILRQFSVILLVTFLGELCKAILPFPIPASIYGMVIMLAALCTGILKLDDVEQAGNFLIEIMPIMFVPAAAGLISAWGQLRPILVPVTVITIISTVIVMAVTGHTAQFVLRFTRKKVEK